MYESRRLTSTQGVKTMSLSTFRDRLSRHQMHASYPTIPAKALALTQPYAWAVVHAGKEVENRDWSRKNLGLLFRGPFAIHASKGMTRNQYEDARDDMEDIGITCPPPHELLFGGIIGTSMVVEVVTAHKSPWFVGPYGLVLADTKPCDFIAVKGMLGFFDWQPEPGNAPCAPKQWMRDWKAP